MRRGRPGSDTLIARGPGTPVVPGPSPALMTGYLGNPAATASTIDPGGWLHTGDIACFDAEGNLFIVDRVKELIKVKGFQVARAELEALLRGHPAVADAAVIGVPTSGPANGPRPTSSRPGRLPPRS